MSRTIALVEHRPEWATQYEQEKEHLDQLWGERIVRVHHVGSTAIQAICAKPTIDLLVEVHDLCALDSLDEMMRRNGYIPKGENGIAGRRYYIRGTVDIHEAHIHAFNVGHPEVARHLRFVAYLRAHPDEAKAYAELKQQLAKQYPHDGSAYTAGKTIFIQTIDTKAKDEEAK